MRCWARTAAGGCSAGRRRARYTATPPHRSSSRTRLTLTCGLALVIRGYCAGHFMELLGIALARTVAIPFTGGCACGAIRYECLALPLRMLNCHCRDCQLAGGSGLSPSLIMARGAVRLTKGQPEIGRASWR